MGAAIEISIDDYLASAYEPDMDYVDGVLEDRNVGELDHADLQGQLVALLKARGFRYTIPELRLRVSSTRFRVPDISVFRERPSDQVPSTPPLLAIEILSPEDRWGRLQNKLEDYTAMGIPCVWVLDPKESRAWLWNGNTLTVVTNLAHTSEPSLQLKLSDVFGRS